MNNQTFQILLKKYAEVTVQTGLNLQSGQRLIIKAPIEARELVHRVAEAAYRKGCVLVNVLWEDETFQRIRYTNAPENSFSEYSASQIKPLLEAAENNHVILNIKAESPGYLDDIDTEIIKTAHKATINELSKLQDYLIKNATNWCMINAATPRWAEALFPNIGTKKAVERLWEAIFTATRIYEDDPIASWQSHIANLQKRIRYLNQKHYSALHFKSQKTDLTVKLAKDHEWRGGVVETANENKISFTPNLPTEEIFTAPHKDKVNGIVYSTKPLVYQGNKISKFWLRFKNGEIQDFDAQEGKEMLQYIIELDNGSSRLGEIGLVGNESPVAQTNITFQNTLFDENSATHLAVGKALPYSIKNGLNLTKEQFANKGGNTSSVHIDFMIGSGEMDVHGVTDTQTEQIMQGGSWAI